jgi:hypothetical protein
MKHLQLILGAALFLTAGISAEKTPADSSNSAVSGTASSTDGDLILDDSDNSILPAEQKKTVTPAAAPTAKSALPSDAPAFLKTDSSTASTPAAGQTTAHEVLVPVQKVTDEELILDGGDEDLLGREKTVRPKILPVDGRNATDTMHAGSEASAGQTPAAFPLPSPVEFADSAASSATAPFAAVKPAPADVGKEHAINFARNLKEYRSPKLAMLMSLILPGSGQVYATSNLSAAAFGVIEAAVVSTGLVLSAKARKVKKQAHDFADHHYDTTRFRSYLDSLGQFLPTMFSPDTNALQEADSIYNEVIFMSGEDKSFFYDAKSRNDNYYGYLDGGASSPFIRGWDDVEPDFTSSGFQDIPTSFGVYQGDTSTTAYLVFLKSDPARAMYGISANQERYSGLLRDSRNWASYSRGTFLSLLINHVAASVMAGIAAKRHNDALLGKESFWRRIDLEQQYVFTGSWTTPGYALKVAF